VHFEPEQMAPAAHVGVPPSAPGQQRVPIAPQAQMGVAPASPLQLRPVLQLVPPQQGWFELPHSQTFEVVHSRLAPHAWLSQHVWPSVPHWRHVGPEAVLTQVCPCVQPGEHTAGPSGMPESMPPDDDAPEDDAPEDDAPEDEAPEDDAPLEPLLEPLLAAPLLDDDVEPSAPPDDDPVVVASGGSMTVASGALGGGGASITPVVGFTSFGSAQYDTFMASFAQTRPMMPSTLQSADTVQRLRQR
jgi:hypothetical protein